MIHTPGKWNFKGRGINVNGCRIATMAKGPEISDDGHNWRFMEQDEQDANARLIAAAPDLLGALKDAHALLRCFVTADYGDEIAKAVLDGNERAIAKAEGR